MDTELISRMLTANNLALSLNAIRRHDYPLAFHLLYATYSSLSKGQEFTGYYRGMNASEALLLRKAINAAWQQELSQLTNAMIERMSVDGMPLSVLGAYLSQSGLPWVTPRMSYYDLLAAMMRNNDTDGIWRYLAADRRGPRLFAPSDVCRDPDGFIAKLTERSRPVLLWSTRVALQPTATCGELFGWATVEATFGRKTQIIQSKRSIRLEHVNLRFSVDGYGPNEQPVGKSLLDRTVEVWLWTDQISITR